MAATARAPNAYFTTRGKVDAHSGEVATVGCMRRIQAHENANKRAH